MPDCPNGTDIVLLRPPDPSLGENPDDYEEDEKIIPPDGGLFICL